MVAIQVCNEKDRVGWRKMKKGQFEGTNNNRKVNSVLKVCPERNKIAVIKKRLPDLQQSEGKFLLSFQHGKKKKDFPDITKNNKKAAANVVQWGQGSNSCGDYLRVTKGTNVKESRIFLHGFRNLLRPDSMS